MEYLDMASFPRTTLVALLLIASGCAPAPTPIPNETTIASAAVALPPASISAEALPFASPSASAVPSAPTPAPDLGAAVPFHCFSWAHQRDFSTDCYRTQTECRAAAKAMVEGARLPTECEARPHASCTTLRGTDERCFGDTANCGRYRAFVGRNQIETSVCVPR